MKSIFEQIGGTYTMQGDYRLPNLTLPAEEERPIGVWGQRRQNYLKHNRKVLYYNLLTSGKLHSHLPIPKNRHKNSFLGWQENSPIRKMLPNNLKPPTKWRGCGG